MSQSLAGSRLPSAPPARRRPARALVAVLGAGLLTVGLAAPASAMPEGSSINWTSGDVFVRQGEESEDIAVAVGCDAAGPDCVVPVSIDIPAAVAGSVSLTKRDDGTMVDGTSSTYTVPAGSELVVEVRFTAVDQTGDLPYTLTFGTPGTPEATTTDRQIVHILRGGPGSEDKTVSEPLTSHTDPTYTYSIAYELQGEYRSVQGPIRKYTSNPAARVISVDGVVQASQVGVYDRLPADYRLRKVTTSEAGRVGYHVAGGEYTETVLDDGGSVTLPAGARADEVYFVPDDNSAPHGVGTLVLDGAWSAAPTTASATNCSEALYVGGGGGGGSFAAPKSSILGGGTPSVPKVTSCVTTTFLAPMPPTYKRDTAGNVLGGSTPESFARVDATFTPDGGGAPVTVHDVALSTDGEGLRQAFGDIVDPAAGGTLTVTEVRPPAGFEPAGAPVTVYYVPGRGWSQDRVDLVDARITTTTTTSPVATTTTSASPTTASSTTSVAVTSTSSVPDTRTVTQISPTTTTVVGTSLVPVPTGTTTTVPVSASETSHVSTTLATTLTATASATTVTGTDTVVAGTSTLTAAPVTSTAPASTVTGAASTVTGTTVTVTGAPETVQDSPVTTTAPPVTLTSIVPGSTVTGTPLVVVTTVHEGTTITTAQLVTSTTVTTVTPTRGIDTGAARGLADLLAESFGSSSGSSSGLSGLLPLVGVLALGGLVLAALLPHLPPIVLAPPAQNPPAPPVAPGPDSPNGRGGQPGVAYSALVPARVESRRTR